AVVVEVATMVRGPAGAETSSTNVSHISHDGQRPIHCELSCPHDWQTNRLRTFAICIPLLPLDTSSRRNVTSVQAARLSFGSYQLRPTNRGRTVSSALSDR